jgi:hypothetical protein
MNENQQFQLGVLLSLFSITIFLWVIYEALQESLYQPPRFVPVPYERKGEKTVDNGSDL